MANKQQDTIRLAMKYNARNDDRVSEKQSEIIVSARRRDRLTRNSLFK